MTEQIEVKIPFNDLTRIILECATCRAETTIDISEPKQRQIINASRPICCPVCSTSFDSKVAEG